MIRANREITVEYEPDVGVLTVKAGGTTITHHQDDTTRQALVDALVDDIEEIAADIAGELAGDLHADEEADHG